MLLDYEQISDQDLEAFGPHLWPNHNAMNTVTRFFSHRPDLAYLQAARAANLVGSASVKIRVDLMTHIGTRTVRRQEGSLVHNIKYAEDASEDVSSAMENLYRLLERIMPRHSSPKHKCTVHFCVHRGPTISISGRWM
jgi:hypothetical protein